MIQPIQRKRASDQICDVLKQMIRDGEYQPGEKLPSENALAKQFGVSRAPIREAISVLVASGIVESVQGGGNFVKETPLVDLLDTVTFEMTTRDEVLDLLEYRMIIETEAARIAAIRRTDEELQAIQQALEQFQETVKDDRTVGSAADFLFHMAIVQATHNEFLIRSIENARELYQQALDYSLAKNIGMRRKRRSVYEEHLRIYEAIRDQNPHLAAESMSHHLGKARLKLGDLRVQQQFD